MRMIWIDYMAPCDAFFFKAIEKEISSAGDFSLFNTARSHAETVAMISEQRIKAKVIGRHDTDSGYSQIASFLERNAALMLKLPRFDVSLSLANIYAILVSKARMRPCVSIIDNDLVEFQRSMMERLAARIHASADWIIAPEAYPTQLTIEKGADPARIIKFPGFKEDVYVADYRPDPLFNDLVPFQEFVVVRPEALYSTYVHEKKSITGAIVGAFLREKMNVIYLPRREADLQFVARHRQNERLWIPPHPLNGLDLVFHSKGILTGSGTFAREAACMGQVAVSFFPDRLLAVDKELIQEGRMYHSRNPERIVEHVLNKRNQVSNKSTENSRAVKREFVRILWKILNEVAG